MMYRDLGRFMERNGKLQIFAYLLLPYSALAVQLVVAVFKSAGRICQDLPPPSPPPLPLVTRPQFSVCSAMILPEPGV